MYCNEEKTSWQCISWTQSVSNEDSSLVSARRALYIYWSANLNSYLIHNQSQYEIDHILPLSLTFDDSLSNKVLVLATANQEKGQRTPYNYLQSTTTAWSYREFKDYVIKCKGIGKKKREYLTFEEDINVFEVRSKFIQRNLVDTRYASKVILNFCRTILKELGNQLKYQWLEVNLLLNYVVNGESKKHV